MTVVASDEVGSEVWSDLGDLVSADAGPSSPS